MKNFLLILTLVLLILPSFGWEEVYLDLNASDIHQYKTFSTDLGNTKSNQTDNFSEEKDMVLHPFQYLKDERASDLYTNKTITHKKEKKIGKAKFGAKYDTTLAPESVSQKRTLYTNYDLTEKMSVGADYQTNSLGGMEAQKQGTIGVGPEYQLNKKIKLKNKYSKNLGNDTSKGEVSIEYKPFQDGRMDFNAGAAQTMQDSGQGSSQVNFGTNFRF